jgi:hypothetical protein
MVIIILKCSEIFLITAILSLTTIGATKLAKSSVGKVQ